MVRGLVVESWREGICEVCRWGMGPARPATSLFEEDGGFLGDGFVEMLPASLTFLGSFRVKVGSIRVASYWVRVTEGSF